MTSQPMAENSEAQNDVLWQPSQAQIEDTFLHTFKNEIEKSENRYVADYQELWEWSVENSEKFWDKVWDFCEVIGEKGSVILKDGDKMPGAQFFPEAQISYAENLLRRRDDNLAMVFKKEKGQDVTITFQELYQKVSQWQQAFVEAGIGQGDRVAGYLPNMPETIIALLAANSLGAIWSSASPDFGVQGVLDRFGQVEPKILICVDGYYYNGKEIDCLSKVQDVVPQIPSLEKVIVVPFLNENADISGVEKAVRQADFVDNRSAAEVTFQRLPFNHPLYIMFSSGTTGVPKCIVHGQGGSLIQHMKEHKLQSNIKSGDKVFYFTTCGWMMWNWLVSALASEATLMLFDGSPFYPDGNVLWDYAQEYQCTFFGTSAKYIDALKNDNYRPCDSHDLSSVRTIASTGSPLVHESFDYVYDAIKRDVHLASISGGTDIVSCFVLGNPASPVRRGEIQGAGLGLAVDIYDDEQKSVALGSGELVCTKPFPCMPVAFWNDPHDSRYKSAYFENYENIWCHGDWVERTVDQGLIIHGRSDATLNPGGVRIGTAEIYRQVEQIEAVKESVCVGQDWDGDVRVILFVILNDGYGLDDNLIKEIRTKIRTGASPRHMPAKVIGVNDIPRTKSGKITELAVRDVIMGRPIKNKEALANPEALTLYENLKELQA